MMKSVLNIFPSDCCYEELSNSHVYILLGDLGIDYNCNKNACVSKYTVGEQVCVWVCVCV